MHALTAVPKLHVQGPLPVMLSSKNFCHILHLHNAFLLQLQHAASPITSIIHFHRLLFHCEMCDVTHFVRSQRMCHGIHFVLLIDKLFKIGVPDSPSTPAVNGFRFKNHGLQELVSRKQALRTHSLQKSVQP